MKQMENGVNGKSAKMERKYLLYKQSDFKHKGEPSETQGGVL
jgi:hypothetical protein